MEKNTLINLLDTKGIVIPIIQRDYVQGNDLNRDKRNNFLDNIFTHLKNDDAMNLDFIYGRTIQGDGFVPVDGQQRLTTLFLLHWALSKKGGAEIYNKYKALFHKFSYKTRVSSRRFCELLVDSECTLKQGISDTLRQNTRYDEAWDNDPTVSSMLDMLEELAIRLDKEDQQTIELMFNRLVKGTITFDELDMGADFKLTDDLYIKMNARGKQLTDFENFKALFIEFVERQYPNEKEDFCTKLEYDWTQLFWNSAFESWNNFSETEKKQKAYPIVDGYYFNLLKVITQLLFFQDKNERSVDADAFDRVQNYFKSYEEVYSNPANFRFLVQALDFLYGIAHGNKVGMHTYFEKIFFDDGNAALTGPIDKVRIFVDGNSVNIFDAVITKGLKLDTKLKILFYAYVDYSINNNDGNLKTYMRLVRNYIESKRQKDGLKYSPDIRINRFSTYLKELNKKVNEVPSHVKDPDWMLELESFKYLRGNIGNVKLQEEEKMPLVTMSMKEIWSVNDDALISQALIACGFDGLYIKDCALGKTYTFGSDSNWDRVLDSSSDNPSNNWLRNLLSEYIKRTEATPREKLNAIINEQIDSMKDAVGNWKLCFLKYPQILQGTRYFAWKSDNEVEELRSFKSNPLLAFHINVYVKYICEIEKSELPWTRYSELTGSFTISRTKFQITENGWSLNGGDETLNPRFGEDIISVALNRITEAKNNKH